MPLEAARIDDATVGPCAVAIAEPSFEILDLHFDVVALAEDHQNGGSSP